MLSARKQPGVINYLEQVVVLGEEMVKRSKHEMTLKCLIGKKICNVKGFHCNCLIQYGLSTCDDQLIIVGYHCDRGHKVVQSQKN